MTTPRDLALLAAEVMDAKRADDVIVLEVARHTPVTDYFVIGSAQSTVQIRAVVEAVEEELTAQGARPLNREGDPQARWVLLDFGAVVVHVFGPEARRYYTLERLWADAPILER
ncbi:MAG TPA: ribosome silencing factor [bacterium]